MSRKGWLRVGLSLLLGMGVGVALPPMGVQSGRAHDVTDDGNITEYPDRVEVPLWADQSSEKGEIEIPRWGDLSGEQAEIDAPRRDDRSGEQVEIEAPRA